MAIRYFDPIKIYVSSIRHAWFEFYWFEKFKHDGKPAVKYGFRAINYNQAVFWKSSYKDYTRFNFIEGTAEPNNLRRASFFVMHKKNNGIYEKVPSLNYWLSTNEFYFSIYETDINNIAVFGVYGQITPKDGDTSTLSDYIKFPKPPNFDAITFKLSSPAGAINDYSAHVWNGSAFKQVTQAALSDATGLHEL
ncbi:MAG: hypothetical protein Q4E22_03250 [Coriobacteriia bacterium]|nr:hypothetical protein [Coriobacteriia bacterium]